MKINWKSIINWLLDLWKVFNSKQSNRLDKLPTLPKSVEIANNDKPISVTVESTNQDIKPVEIVKTIETKIVSKKEIKPQLVLVREIFNETETLGKLYIDDKFICWVLEDKDRKLEIGGKKVFGETSIPKGTYQIIINWSNRFQRMMPLLLDVPQFQGIRIHNGLTHLNTHGCLLPVFFIKNKIQKSKEATKMVTEIIAEKLKTEKIYILIK